MIDGHVFEHRVDYPKGEPENPMSEDELKEKFISMTSHAGFDNDKSTFLYEMIMTEDVVDFKKFV